MNKALPLSLLLLVLGMPSPLGGQEAPGEPPLPPPAAEPQQAAETSPGEEIPPEEEAPPALWSWNLWDQEVELRAEGRWDVQFLGGLGFALEEGQFSPAYPYPGLTLGAVFKQTPELDLELRLAKRWFFRVLTKEELEKSTFLGGYEGLEGESLRWVKVGTMPFGLRSYADWALPESSPGNLQGLVGWDTEFTRHDLLVRQENGLRETKTFQGSRERSVHRWNLGHWSRFRRFQLPWAPVSGFRILVEDQEGLRPPTPGEVSFNVLTGQVTPGDLKGFRLWITWNGVDGSSWTDPLSGQEFFPTDLTSRGQGGFWWPLDRRETYQPWEEKNLYTPPRPPLRPGGL